MSEEIKYPFAFDELKITDKVLDVLGFSEYWAGASEYGERTFGIKKSEHQYEKWYRIVDHDEMEDGNQGYISPARYYAQNFSSPFNARVSRRIYFLHDLYEDISDNAPDLLDFFIEKTKEKGVNMFPFIQSYLEYKENAAK
jgi:hypothetical protein